MNLTALDKPVQFLKGVGPSRADALRKIDAAARRVPMDASPATAHMSMSGHRPAVAQSGFRHGRVCPRKS